MFTQIFLGSTVENNCLLVQPRISSKMEGYRDGLVRQDPYSRDHCR